MKYKTVARHAAAAVVVVLTHAGYTGSWDTATTVSVVSLIVFAVVLEVIGHYLDG